MSVCPAFNPCVKLTGIVIGGMLVDMSSGPVQLHLTPVGSVLGD